MVGVRRNAVLKISIVDKRKQRRLVLEGMLVAPWAAELERACELARADLDGRELVVDLKSLVAINEDGEKVLQALMSNGVKLRSRGMFTKHVLRQIARKIRKTIQEIHGTVKLWAAFFFIAAGLLPISARGATTASPSDFQSWDELDVLTRLSRRLDVTWIARVRLSEEEPNPAHYLFGTNWNFGVRKNLRARRIGIVAFCRPKGREEHKL
jgi:hypothetical protein